MSGLPIPDLNLGGTSSASGLADSSSVDDFIQDIVNQTDATTSSGDVAFTGSSTSAGAGTADDDFFEKGMDFIKGNDERRGQGATSIVIPLVAAGVVGVGVWYLYRRWRG